MNSRNVLTGWLGIIIFLFSSIAATAHAEELSADAVMKKSFAVYGGDDSLSKITFIFQEKGDLEKKLVYSMAWKKFQGASDVDTKVIMFRDFPPDAKGVSYLGIFYKPELNKNDDEWIYLPELRMVRRLSHTGPKHAKEEEFSKSELRQFDLVPRNPDDDTHQLLPSETMEGVACHVIESIPKKGGGEFYPYGKVVRWISKENFLPLRIDYYDERDKLQKQQFTKWKKIGDAWVWEEVVGTNIQTGNKTLLTITDIKVNVGLTDESFSKRTMQLGIENVK